MAKKTLVRAIRDRLAGKRIRPRAKRQVNRNWWRPTKPVRSTMFATDMDSTALSGRGGPGYSSQVVGRAIVPAPVGRPQLLDVGSMAAERGPALNISGLSGGGGSPFRSSGRLGRTTVKRTGMMKVRR